MCHVTNATHNHELEHEPVLATATARLEDVPKELVDLAYVMAENGTPMRYVANTLRGKAKKMVPPVTLPNGLTQMLRDRIRPSGAARDLDFSGLLEMLAKRVHPYRATTPLQCTTSSFPMLHV